MKNNMNLYFLILIIAFLTSCEGFVVLKGNIKSAKRDENISKARIELLDIPTSDTFLLSDSNGNFIVRSKMIGMIKKPKYRLRISKDSFKTVELKFNYDESTKTSKLINDTLTIKLEEQ